jgi:hypothetical protein
VGCEVGRGVAVAAGWHVLAVAAGEASTTVELAPALTAVRDVYVQYESVPVCVPTTERGKRTPEPSTGPLRDWASDHGLQPNWLRDS